MQVGNEPTGTYYYNGTHPLQTTNFIPSPTRINMTLNGPYRYAFTSSSSATPVTSFDGATAYSDMPTGGGVTITATATNSACSIVGRFAFAPGGSSFVFAPNPASTELTVTAAADAPPMQAGGPAASLPFEAALYDSQGHQVKTQRSGHGQAVLDVRDLPNGLYYLRVGTGKNALMEHVQVAH